VETTPMSYPGIAWNCGIYYNNTPILGERALNVISHSHMNLKNSPYFNYSVKHSVWILYT